MVLLAQLNDDVLSAICSYLMARRSLLNLALTCRALCSAIIPTFLYARLELETPYINDSAAVRLRSFFDAICQRESIARAVRHLEIPGSQNSCLYWGNILPRTRNLCSLKIQFHSPPWTLLKGIHMIPHLHTLSVDDCNNELIELLRDAQFRNLDLQFILHEYPLTPDSALGEILLRSRDTLSELKLSGITWCFGVPSASSAASHNDRDPVWPCVTVLRLWEVTKNIHPLHLSYHFPSTICFDTRNGLVSLDHPQNRRFFAGLRSLNGRVMDFELALGFGAMLRHAHARTQEFDNKTEAEFDNLPLQNTLHSLTLCIEPKFFSPFLVRLAVTCPKLSFLCLRVDVMHASGFGIVLNAILDHLSDLPLECLRLMWKYVPIFSDANAAHTYDSSVTMFASRAPVILPSLRLISSMSDPFYVDIFGTDPCSTHTMRRLITARGVADKFTPILKEDGSDLVNYYEWRWMDQVEEHVVEPS
ncbi:hypothetical protein BOTBODRAFT_62959 [Botryobasidium botryosum FD-172 SS1]|uniref:F-box domain-containing protein n=1 Tax=Botryobasidium botryosum (strain FD-172 SS1) TaxID=930990 RepID=A0A067MY83_BOTB1|nr:hypothetical protein BOTBODRAFT_62959 [Botryobasidium botryosum FD-172 SS1]